MQSALDAEFLKNIETDYAAVEDNRVAQAMCNMLGRNVVIITSRQEGATCDLLRPLNTKPIKSTLSLGHVYDHHFVPLQRKGRWNYLLGYYD